MTPDQRQATRHHLSHELRRTLFEIVAEVSLDDDFADAGPMTFYVAVHTGGTPTAVGIAERFLADMGAKARNVRARELGDGLPLSQTGLPSRGSK